MARRTIPGSSSSASTCAAVFLEAPKPQPVVLFEVVKGWVTGTMPDIGEMHHVRK